MSLDVVEFQVARRMASWLSSDRLSLRVTPAKLSRPSDSCMEAVRVSGIRFGGSAYSQPREWNVLAAEADNVSNENWMRALTSSKNAKAKGNGGGGAAADDDLTYCLSLTGDGAMDFDAGIPMSRAAAPVTDARSLSASLTQDAMWQMNMRSSETMEAGPYPERAGEPDCSYYIRTGLCRFGATCRFNHPPNRKLAIAAARMKGEFPERIGQPECQACISVEVGGSTVYPTVQSPTTPGQQSYAGGITNWSRASFIPSPRWQAQSSYTPLIVPQGVVSVPGWNAYSGQLGSVSSPEGQQQTAGNSQMYGTSQQGEPENSGSQGGFSPYGSGSIPVGFYALQRENVFPERPREPECLFYMKTGDCKYGAVCR
ncbi:hypothetical protein C1H46_020227 [Malus baccata]|uniref:C3H1-type domain-containing protein n=1 Tax=Malus baccata TaxID=106549 RepID=A0A540M6P8_MALBA|nr:hypothetical protein C1H46_020227 [Malus baccata]